MSNTENISRIKNAWDKGCELGDARVKRKIRIAERLKQLRKEAKLTQAEASERIGSNRISFAGYESGRYEHSPEILIRLADLYNVSMDYITCRSEDKAKTLEEENTDIADRVAKLEKMLSELTKK